MDDEKKGNNMMLWVIGLIVIVVIIGIVVVVIRNQDGGTKELTTETTQAPTNSVIVVSDQTGGSSVTIDSASLVGSGYIVIHEQKDGELGPVIGHSSLYSAGTYKNISVTLDRTSTSGETLYGMLHDDDGNGDYEFPGADTPTKNNAGEVVVLPLAIQ